jgi:hypothetical protein
MRQVPRVPAHSCTRRSSIIEAVALCVCTTRTVGTASLD